MKKIIPFNNVVDFNTDVKEITAISLEHEMKKYPDMISGVFYISGEYKITEGLLEKEKFNFELPFDIALTSNYNLDTLIVDIDDFRYELVSDKNLKVNIDLYIDGEEIEVPLPRNIYTEELIKEEHKDIREINEEILSTIKSNVQEEICEEEIELKNSFEETSNKEKDNKTIDEEYDKTIEIKQAKAPEENEINDSIDPVRIDLLKDMLTNNKEDNMNEELNTNINNINNNNNQNINDNNNESENEFEKNNLFNPDGEEKYVTYRVYKVLETDTIDTILTKYNITKEQLGDYNNIENINPGDKLIIPTYEK